VSLPGPDVPLGGGLLDDPQDLRRLGGAELLEVSQGDQLPVKGVKAVRAAKDAKSATNTEIRSSSSCRATWPRHLAELRFNWMGKTTAPGQR
jgi:hypothetical protein